VFGGAFHRAAEDWTNARIAGIADSEAIAKGEAAFIAAWEAGIPEEVRSKLEIDGNRRSVTNFRRLFKGYRERFPIESYTEIHGCEIPFTYYLGKTPVTGVDVYWSGVLDRIVTWMEGVYYRDTKTTSFSLDEDFFDQFKLSGQMKGYVWAGQQRFGKELGQFAGVVVEGVKVEGPLKTKVRDPKDLVQGEVIPIEQAHIDEWVVDTLWRIDHVHQVRERGHYTMNSGDLCKQFRGGCAYRRICTALPHSRDLIKAEHYHKRVWSPFNKEGDHVES
jgi:hypothetical protein